jgi:3',5'-cyclic AMP phosphodiesterase CpdA
MRLQFKFRFLVFTSFLLIGGAVLAQKYTLSILHITDLHVIFNQDAYQQDMIQNRKLKQYDKGEDRLRQFLQRVPEKTKADFVIATGDMIDFFEAENRNGKMLDLGVEQFARLVDDYHIPFSLTLGNHDAFTFNWRDNKLYHNQNFSGRSRASWTRNLSCFKNGTYYSKVFQIGKTTYRLIFLDNSFYQFLPKDKIEVPWIDKPQLYWLNAQLHESEDDIEIILMHIPFASRSQMGSSNELYTMLAENPTVKLILSGHHHKNVIMNLPSSQGMKITQVQTGSLVENTDNWRLIRLTEKNIMVSVPGNIKDELVIPVK